MSNIIYISKKCQYCKKILIMIYKNPMLKNMFNIVSVDNGPVPPFIKTVPTLYNENNNSIITGNDLFNLINSYVQQNSGQEQAPQQDQHQQQQQQPPGQSSGNGDGDDEELAPWNCGEMGGGISSCYSFLDNENPIQNSFELIGDGGVAGGGGDLPKPEMSGGDVGSEKRKVFDNDYENFIKSRNAGIPQSNNRA